MVSNSLQWDIFASWIFQFDSFGRTDQYDQNDQIDQKLKNRKLIRAGTREFPPGKSREFPENFQSRLVPGIFSISREISGNFYVLWLTNFSISLNFGNFSLGSESNFTVKNDTNKA